MTKEHRHDSDGFVEARAEQKLPCAARALTGEEPPADFSGSADTMAVRPPDSGARDGRFFTASHWIPTVPGHGTARAGVTVLCLTGGGMDWR